MLKLPFHFLPNEDSTSDLEGRVLNNFLDIRRARSTSHPIHFYAFDPPIQPSIVMCRIVIAFSI